MDLSYNKTRNTTGADKNKLNANKIKIFELI